MKQLYLFFLLFFVIILVGSIEYHGNRRFYTIVIDGKTYIALRALNEQIKLIFPKEKNFSIVASDINVYSPSNEKCQDTKNTLKCTLIFDVEKHISVEICTGEMLAVRKVTALFFEQCNVQEQKRNYKIMTIEEMAGNLLGGACFRNVVPFRVYDHDNEKYVMDLQVSGSFDCQAFMVLPTYMQIEDDKLIDNGRLKLNESFAGHNSSFWWKTKNDSMLSNAIYFDSNSNVKINILKSTKSIPYFLRIGSRQPLPSLKFEFDETCIGAEFEIYINLKDTVDCQIRIPLVDGGFRFSTKLSSNEEFIEDPSFSPTLIFDKTQVFFKIDSPLTIKSYRICDISNPDVAADQFVIQISPLHLVAPCSKAKVTVLKKDVANGIEILIDRTKIVEPTTAKTPNSSVASSSTVATAQAGIEWWWYVGGGILLFLLLCVALPMCIICVYRRKKKETTKRKFREVSKSVVSDEIQVQPNINDSTNNYPATKKSKSKDKKTEQTANEDPSVGHEIRIQKSVERKPPRKLSKSFREKYGKIKVIDVEKSEVKNIGEDENPLPSFMKNMEIVYKPDPEGNNSRTTVQTTQNETTFDTGSTQNPSEKTQKSTTGSTIDKAPKQNLPTHGSQSNDQSSKITMELN